MAPRRHQRPLAGVSLIEALVALAVMSFGMMALLGVQTTLRYNNEIARQVSEATRLATEDIERLRFFNDVVPVAGQTYPSWQELDSAADSAVTLPGDTGNTAYTLTRSVALSANGLHKAVEVVVTWTDRNNQSRSVTLNNVIGRIEPVLSGMLSVPPVPGAQGQNRGRHAAVPPQSVDILDGTSAFKPSSVADVVWRFNNLTGNVTSVCTGVTADQASITVADLNTCSAASGRLVSGVVQSHGGTGVTSADALAPAGPALPLDASAPLSFLNVDYNAPVNQSRAPQCYADSPPSAALASGRSAVKYACLIYLTNAGSGWGGKLEVRVASAYPNGDAVPGGANAYKVCRYTKSSEQFTVNEDHPRTYCHTGDLNTCTQRVTTSLSNQNFLVIRSTESCPGYTPSSSDLVNPNTLIHQPE